MAVASDGRGPLGLTMEESEALSALAEPGVTVDRLRPAVESMWTEQQTEQRAAAAPAKLPPPSVIVGALLRLTHLPLLVTHQNGGRSFFDGTGVLREGRPHGGPSIGQAVVRVLGGEADLESAQSDERGEESKEMSCSSRRSC